MGKVDGMKRKEVDSTGGEVGSGGKEVVVRKEFPEAGVLPGVINEKLLGKNVVQRGGVYKVMDNSDAARLMREYGYEVHPATGRPRAITVLMALEAEALSGNISAAKEFLDRTSGKTVEMVAINHSRFGDLSDRDLLKMVVGDKGVRKGRGKGKKGGVD